jgi:OmpR family response regulator RpaB
LNLYNKKILVADSDGLVRKFLLQRLTSFGYSVFIASNGSEVLSIFKRERPDLILLDILLPRLDGYEVCFKIRADSQVPIIIVTALGKISNRITGLEVGADDYIVKPFAPKELDARIHSALRKTHIQLANSPFKYPNVNQFGPLSLNMNKKQVLKNGIKVNMTTIEFSLLELLIENLGVPLSRIQILDSIWGYTPQRSGDTRIVDVHISRLRLKLEDDPRNPDFIKTRRGIGYLFQIY